MRPPIIWAVGSGTITPNGLCTLALRSQTTANIVSAEVEGITSSDIEPKLITPGVHEVRINFGSKLRFNAPTVNVKLYFSDGSQLDVDALVIR